MQLNNFIFSNKLSVRILRHILFWMFWYVYQVIIFLYNNTNIQSTFWLTLTVRCEKLLKVFPISIIQCYIVVYWLVPKLLTQKKYLLFNFGLLLTSASVIFFVDIVTYNRFDFVSLWYGLMSYTSRGGPEICLIFVTIKMLKTWYVKEREKEILLKENLSAELQLLKAQMHPHFLFNTLNNIYSFILSDAVKAQNHVKKLEKMLRYMITECDKPLVPLSQEIKMINDYLELEKVRYGNNLDIEMKVTDDRNKLVAPLLMIPFIENSFKHGTSKMLTNPWIKLNIEVKENGLYFTLQNSKPDLEIHTKNGIGLTNVKKRLDLLYPGKYYLKTESTRDTFIVELQIPLHEKFSIKDNVVINELTSVLA